MDIRYKHACVYDWYRYAESARKTCAEKNVEMCIKNQGLLADILHSIRFEGNES